MTRLRKIERAILPVILAAITIAVPGILRAAPARRARHESSHKTSRHVVVHHRVRHVRRRRTRHVVHHRYYRTRYHRRRYHRYRRYHHYRRYPYHPSAERIDQIQRALARAGFYQGDPSGTWNSQTVEAMKGFQQAHGLDATGKIDAVTLQKLGLGSDIAGLAPPRPLIAANRSGSSE